jgi:hypothetical protein
LSLRRLRAFDDITRSNAINQLSGQEASDWPNTFRSSRFIPAVEYIRAQRARTLLMREMDALMSQWDVFRFPRTWQREFVDYESDRTPGALCSLWLPQRFSAGDHVYRTTLRRGDTFACGHGV